MIRRIEVENFRGIRSGVLDPLVGLTVLTGVNGSGKSAVLDAMHVCLSRSPVDALMLAIQRRRAAPLDPRWLVLRGQSEAAAKTDAVGVRLLHRVGPPPGIDPAAYDSHVQVYAGELANLSSMRDAPGWIGLNRETPQGLGVHRFQPVGDLQRVRLLDPSVPRPVEARFSDAVRRGARSEIDALMRALVPGYASLDILTEPDGTPLLYLDAGGSGPVPLGLAGDGIQAFAQLVVELAGERDSVVLIEEPEVFQHPRALHQTAHALWAAVDRGVQVIATTHSLELIDAIASLAGDHHRRDELVLFNLALVAGELRTSRWNGAEVGRARGELEIDLR